MQSRYPVKKLAFGPPTFGGGQLVEMLVVGDDGIDRTITMTREQYRNFFEVLRVFREQANCHMEISESIPPGEAARRWEAHAVEELRKLDQAN